MIKLSFNFFLFFSLLGLSRISKSWRDGEMEVQIKGNRHSNSSSAVIDEPQLTKKTEWSHEPRRGDVISNAFVELFNINKPDLSTPSMSFMHCKLNIQTISDEAKIWCANLIKCEGGITVSLAELLWHHWSYLAPDIRSIQRADLSAPHTGCSDVALFYRKRDIQYTPEKLRVFPLYYAFIWLLWLILWRNV